MNWRLRLLKGTDRVLSVLLVLVLVGATLAFGGAVWWFKPALAVLTTLLMLAWLARVALQGAWPLLKSPLTPLGLLALLLAIVQLAPLPGRLAEQLSPRSREVYTLGTLSERAQADDPSADLSQAVAGRTPISVDRSATLRWLAGAAACLAVFCVVAHFSDRLGHALLIWGGVVASLFLCTAFGIVQVSGSVHGLYGAYEPGKGPDWAPSKADLLAAPNTTVLRGSADRRRPDVSWALQRPDRPEAIGGLMGGPGAFLALGSLALPLALGLHPATALPPRQPGAAAFASAASRHDAPGRPAHRANPGQRPADRPDGRPAPECALCAGPDPGRSSRGEGHGLTLDGRLGSGRGAGRTWSGDRDGGIARAALGWKPARQRPERRLGRHPRRLA